MVCSRCGHDYPSTSARCTRCGHLVINENSSVVNSRLIEFPLRARMPEPKAQRSEQLPAWRLEVAEKVRARKAQQSGNLPKVEQPSAAENCSATPSSTPNSEEYSSSNPKIQAALLRAKRANEKALRASLPRIEPARPFSQTMALASERTATAKALAEPSFDTYLDTEEELPETVSLFKRPSPEIEASDSQSGAVNPVSNLNRQAINSTGLDSLQCKTKDVVVSHPSAEVVVDKPKPIRKPVKCLDENCIIDYLEVEVQKVERASKQTQRFGQVTLQIQATIFLLDFVTILISWLPFLFIANFINGNSGGFTVANILIGVLVSAFYLFSTQLLCSKTFGMMATKTHLINASTGALPSAFLVLVRTAMFYVSLLPALVGFFWTAIDSKHRSWMDIASGTKVIPD